MSYFQWIQRVFPLPPFPLQLSPELIDLWSAFLESIFFLSPSLHLAAFSATPESFFILALSHRHICNVLAKFAYDTLQVFEQKEMFVVDSALYLNAVAPPTVTSSIPSNSMLCDGQFFLYFWGISGLGFVPVWSSPLCRS